ncbi:MAG: SusD/RagB family nutrient-binding outer membrane lipoprotein, partial [Mucilaginibacter sp.]
NGVLAAIIQWGVFGGDAEISADDAQAYLDAHPYDPANGLEMINTQFWAATFFNEYEAWSNYRRTGFPALVPVKNYPGSQSPNAIPRRMAYSTVDKQVNSANYIAAVAGLTGGDKITSRMWWDK